MKRLRLRLELGCDGFAPLTALIGLPIQLLRHGCGTAFIRQRQHIDDELNLPNADVQPVPTATALAGLTRVSLSSTLPHSTASDASERVLKKRAAQSHLSMRFFSGSSLGFMLMHKMKKMTLLLYYLGLSLSTYSVEKLPRILML